MTILINRSETRNSHCQLDPDVRTVFYDGYTQAAMTAASDLLAALAPGSRVGLDYGLDMFGRGSLKLIDSFRKRNLELVEADELIWLQLVGVADHIRARLVQAEYHQILLRLGERKIPQKLAHKFPHQRQIRGVAGELNLAFHESEGSCHKGRRRSFHQFDRGFHQS